MVVTDLLETTLQKPTRKTFINCKPCVHFKTMPVRIVKTTTKNVVFSMPADSQTARDIYEIELFFEHGIRSMWGVWNKELCSKMFSSIVTMNDEGLLEATLGIPYQNGMVRVLEMTDDEYKKMDFSRLMPGEAVSIEVVVTGAWLNEDDMGVKCHAVTFEFIES